MENTKTQLEQQFQDLVNKAKETYPELNESLQVIDSMRQPTEDLQNYLNLTFLDFSQVTTNNRILDAYLG